MPPATEIDDELLASLEPGSFAVFYRRHVEDLVAFFMRRTRNAELAADLTAETFAAALVARARFDPGRGSASAWLYGIALHKLARVERREAAEWRARRRLGMERIELTDADIERIDALGSGDAGTRAAGANQPGAARRDPRACDRRAAVWRDRALAGDLRGGRAQARQPRPGRRPQANGTTRMSDDFFIRLERQLEAAELRELNRAPALRRFVSARRLLSVPLAAAAAAGVVVVALVAIVVTVARESDVERPAAPPGKKVVATDVERGMRFSLDGRVLTVQLLPNRPNATFEAVSGAEISATCGANVAAPPGDPRSETTALPALAGRRDEPELPLPARRLELVPARPPVRRHRRVRELPRRVVGGEGADRRDRQQLGAAVCLHRAGLQRIHEPRPSASR